MVSGIVYSFLILSTNELEGNRFANACIGMLFELLAQIISWLSLEKMDRRKTFMVSCITTAVGLAVIPFLKDGEFKLNCIILFDFIVLITLPFFLGGPNGSSLINSTVLVKKLLNL